MLYQTCASEIRRMAADEALVRIGPIWYGTDEMTTVSGIYAFSDKNITTAQGLRIESALAFSNSRPKVDSIQVILVLDYTRVKSHLQRLMALSQISPVVPVMNPLIAAITQPMKLNRRIYHAYGVSAKIIDEDETQNRAEALTAYARVPVMMKIDFVEIRTMDEASRDLTVVVHLTRVLTANSYGDRTLYVVSIDDAEAQDEYIQEVDRPRGDDVQILSMARMFGINVDRIHYMVEQMESPQIQLSGKGTTFIARKVQAIEGDCFSFQREGRSAVEVGSLYGILAPIGNYHLAQFDFSKTSPDLKGLLGAQSLSRKAKLALSRFISDMDEIELVEYVEDRERMLKGGVPIISYRMRGRKARKSFDAAAACLLSGAFEINPSLAPTDSFREEVIAEAMNYLQAYPDTPLLDTSRCDEEDLAYEVDESKTLKRFGTAASRKIDLLRSRLIHQDQLLPSSYRICLKIAQAM